jgi:hypothetical protein
MHFFIKLISIAITTVLIVFLLIEKTTVKGVSTRVKDFFSNPRCESCGNEKSDYGFAAGGLAPEPLYICANEKCERCEL